MNQEKQKIKVVLDTNIFISSIFWVGNPHKIVELAIDNDIEVYSSPEILTELEKVLKRDFKETQELIDKQIAIILKYSKIVRPTKKVNLVKEDPDDNKILECALSAKAKYIVSGDPHLYNLKKVFRITILTPKDFLEFYFSK